MFEKWKSFPFQSARDKFRLSSLIIFGHILESSFQDPSLYSINSNDMVQHSC
jgi:hypothetical protein